MEQTAASRIQQVLSNLQSRSYVVKEGEYAVVEENREKRSLQIIRSTGRLKFGKSQCSMAPLIGAPYGSVFEVSNDMKELQRVHRPTLLESFTPAAETSKNNSELLDLNEKNQQLHQAVIESMKKEGKAGTEIIGALISNSATFGTKTEFSQDKYKLKKARKYCTYISVHRPTAASVCQLFFDKNTQRVWSLRADSLAILLSLANIGAYAKVLVIDSCLGVVTAAVAERLGGYGKVCAAHVDSGKGAPLDAVQYMNFGEKQKAAICTASIDDLLAAQQVQQQTGDVKEVMVAATPIKASTSQPAATSTLASTSEADAGASRPAAAGDTGVSSTSAQQRPAGRPGQASRHTYAATLQDLLPLTGSGFNSCIIASPKLHPKAVLERVLPLLAPSASFAVFSPWMQPLAEAMHHLQSSRLAVMLQLQESWLRDQQVLPSRTHPEMSMTGTGGYILSGIKIQAQEETQTQQAAVPAPSQGGKRRADTGGRGASGKRFRSR